MDWYAGTVDRTAFDRFTGALAAEFTMITPEGRRQDRAAVLEWVRESYGRTDSGGFEIEIRNVAPVAMFDDSALVRYEEWQHEGDDETGRISTVLLREASAAPGGVVWVDLHETRIGPED